MHFLKGLNFAGLYVSWLRGNRKRFLLAVIFVALVSPVSALGAGAECKPPDNLPPIEVGQPTNIDGLKNQLRYYHCSGAYLRDFERVIDDAIQYVVQRAAKGGKLALVLDIDETSLSNWEQVEAADFAFVLDGPCDHPPKAPCGFEAWEGLSIATALEPTLKLFNTAKAHHVDVFFITSRPKKLQQATETNLHKAGYSDWSDLMVRPDGDTSTVEVYKTAQRKRILGKGYLIIANVGDQYSDLRGGQAERWYKLPNPFYFIP